MNGSEVSSTTSSAPQEHFLLRDVSRRKNSKIFFFFLGLVTIIAFGIDIFWFLADFLLSPHLYRVLILYLLG